jgi:alkanesulfonate monooxygenase SsuD/methylene tetrahydromethanopterin reductase-like flavin-dependent oxidoreductase (luciferase family)
VGTPWDEVWTILSALGASVPRIGLGTLVCGNTYRHPAVLAKMAATLDHVSGGRVVLGLGAGWQQNEHEAYGIPFHTLRERLARLDEACQVVKALFTQERATFKGHYYQLENAPLEPKPVQRPLPLLVGGGGEKVTLRIAARHADEWNVWGDPDTLRRKNGILDGYCGELGRNPREIQRSAVALLFLSDDPAFIEGVRKNVRGRPVIAGNPDEVAAVLSAYCDAGVDELIIPDFNLGPRDRKLATLDRFIREVAPRVA